jgi:hypothetical protein
MKMRSHLPLGWVALGLLAALASGCGTSTTAPGPNSATDGGQVATTLSATATLTDDGLAEDASQTSAASASVGPAGEGFAEPLSVQATIKPHTWWQKVTAETPTWSFAFSDTDTTGHPRACIATLSKHMTGSLFIVPASAADTTQPDLAHTITKPLDKTLTRKILLSRLQFNGKWVWKVVQVTGAFVTTPGATTTIVNIHLHSKSGVDTTVTDPLQWFALRHVIKFGTSDSVTVTVKTMRSDDVVYIHRWDWRHRLHNNLDGTYSFSWVTSAWGGWRYFGIQAMSRGSIYDDTLPFDMQAWHLPFRVVGGQPDVDYYP